MNKKVFFIFVFLMLEVTTSALNILSAQEDSVVEEIYFGTPRRIEGSVSRSQDTNVDHKDIVKQVDDLLYILRKDTLISISLNSKTSAPAQVVSKVKIPADPNAKFIGHESILLTDELVIVFSSYQLDSEDFTDIRFFQRTQSGELEFKDLYTIKTLETGFNEFLFTMTIANNNLIFVSPGYVEDEMVNADLIEQETLLTMEVKRSTVNEDEPVDFDIIKSNQWVNSLSALQINGYTGVFICPLDEVLETGLACNVTGLLGVDTISNYITGDAVYLASPYYAGSKYGVAAQDNHTYLQRTDLAVNPDLTAALESGSENSAFYRIDLEHNGVTAAFYEGRLISGYTYEVNNDSFQAIVRRPSELGQDEESIYGLSFSLSQFTTLPTLLPQSDYQFLFLDEGSIYANRFSEGQVAISNSTVGYHKSEKHELVLWDINDESVITAESEFLINDLYFYDDNVIGLTHHDDGLKMQTWSGFDDLKSIFESDLDSQLLDFTSFDNYFLDNNYRQRVLGIPTIRLQEQSHKPREFKSRDGDNRYLVDMNYFQIQNNGIISSVGKLLAEPEKIQGEGCIEPCDQWYELKRSFRVGDYMYSILDDEIIKGGIKQNKIHVINRMNILVDHTEKDQ